MQSYIICILTVYDISHFFLKVGIIVSASIPVENGIKK